MKKQYNPDEIKELRNSFTKIPPITQVSQNEIKEKQYQSDLAEFLHKNPSANEKRYIDYRIIVLEKVLEEYYETADMYEGEDVDGKELIDGNLITTKTGTASDYWYCKDEFDFFKDKLIELSKPKQLEDNKLETAFLTGLKFATGEAQELYKKSKISFEKLAINLGFKDTDRPYFSATINNNRGVKNLYKNTRVVVQIYSHCIENKIDMCEEFLNKYNQIEPE